MTEEEFWVALEFRVSRELAGIPECQSLGLWCDGFIPRDYRLDQPIPEIQGLVWIGLGPRTQEEWEFRLITRPGQDKRCEIRWEELLPLEDLTSWIAAERKAKLLTLEPGVARRPAP